MPLFEISNQTLEPIGHKNFEVEKELQTLIERNLDAVFKCRFVASEFPTGEVHGGRIDTLALSEERNPVIIEYKKVESSELINQSLFYLSWMNDHRGDFTIQVQKSLGHQIEIDWSDIRVICIAPGYKKYDLHAVQAMSANIELWTYRLFNNSTIYLEEVFQKTHRQEPHGLISDNDRVGMTAGQKAALTRATGSYTFEEHLKGKPDKISKLVNSLREFIVGLDSAIEEVPKKNYVAYRISQNIVCMEIQRQKVVLFLKLDPKTIGPMPSIGRDVSNIGHMATGDFEITIKSDADIQIAMPWIEKAYQKIGG